MIVFTKSYYLGYLYAKQQQEVDFVEDKAGKIYGYEFKWSERKKVKLSRCFVASYNANEKIIDRKNFREFVIV